MQINIHSDDFSHDEFRQIYELLTRIYAANADTEKQTEVDSRRYAIAEHLVNDGGGGSVNPAALAAHHSDGGNGVVELKETEAPLSVDQSLARLKSRREPSANDTIEFNDPDLPPGKNGMPWDSRIHRESKNLDAKGNYLYKRKLDKGLKKEVESEYETIFNQIKKSALEAAVVESKPEVIELMPQPDSRDLSAPYDQSQVITSDTSYAQSSVVSNTPRATADRIAEATEVLESEITHICVMKQITEDIGSGKAPDDLGVCIADYLGLESIIQLKDDTAKCKLFADTWDEAVTLIATMGIPCGEKVAPQFATVIQPLLSSGADE